MNEAEKQRLIDELGTFYKKLRSYQNRQLRRTKEDFSKAKDRALNALRLELQRYHARLKDVISQYGGEAVLPYLGREYEVFSLALGSVNMRHNDFTALDGAISLANKAIAKLESTPIAAPEAQRIENATVQLPLGIFDAMRFHPKVVEASRELFKDGHYRDAIYRAFVEVVNFVKRKAKSQFDGKKLMSTVFSPDNPKIRLNPLETQTDKDEQEGFMYLFMGAVQGIRNPKAHENIIQNNPYIALQLIGFANLLIETVDFWES
jgi:uncharacterized protein (TIGR02391 family)